MEQKKFKLIKNEGNNYGYIVDENDVYIQVHAYAIQYIENLQKELDETKLELLKEKENHEIDLQNWSNDLKELEPMYNENENMKNEIEGLDIEVEFLKDENKELKKEISSGCQTLKEVNRRLMEQNNAQVVRIKELESQLPKWISVKDRPPEGNPVLPALTEDNKVIQWGCWHKCIFEIHGITHWLENAYPPPPNNREE